jgi:putative transposase
MPRTARLLLPGQIYHLTHRCHNGSFFLRFGNIRDQYRLRLWQAALKFSISILNFSITSNHTHILLIVHRPARLSAFMRHLEGEFAAHYNRLKRRSGGFWNERYHATLIEDGCHLWNCMRYIDLNMVRAGVIQHPIDWLWCGYQEIVGRRLRYRVLNLDELLRLREHGDLKAFADWYNIGLDQALKTASGRQAYWTESIAVGSEAFVRGISLSSTNRKRFVFKKGSDEDWYVCDPAGLYSRANPKSGAI